LDELLFLSDDRIKTKIIEEYCDYLKKNFDGNDYEIKVFIARLNDKPNGIATCHLNPNYTSYGRKCGSIGWFIVNNIETCSSLIKECEDFFIKRKINKIRCGVNFPKSLGGLGFQKKGFNEQLLYGVAFLSPKKKEIRFLQKMGYDIESEYTCLRVSSKTWEKGQKIDNNIKINYVPIKEAIGRAEEIHKLASESFQGLLPDTSGGRFDEFIKAFKEMPPSKDLLDKNITLKDLTKNEVFLSAWETCDLEKITPLMPMAYDKKSGELVGVLLGLPDLFQHWSGNKITRVNVDTAIVRKDYKGKGIFSALNNIGQLTCSLYGMTYFEGTTVWTGNSRGINNTDAIQSIMPHCVPIRTHVVLQKRLKH